MEIEPICGHLERHQEVGALGAEGSIIKAHFGARGVVKGWDLGS